MVMHNRRSVGLGILLCGFLAAIPYYRQADDGEGPIQGSATAIRQPFSEQPLQLSIAGPRPDDRPAPIQGLHDVDRIVPLRIEAVGQSVAALPVGPNPTVPHLAPSFPEVTRPNVPSTGSPPTGASQADAPEDQLPRLRPANSSIQPAGDASE